MREIERSISIAERSKVEFRREIRELDSVWDSRGSKFEYTSDPRIQVAIEARLFLPLRKLERGLTEPRFARQKVVWSQRRESIRERLMSSYGYCSQCSEDLIAYVTHVLKGRSVIKIPKNEGVEWLWQLHPDYSEPESDSEDDGADESDS